MTEFGLAIAYVVVLNCFKFSYNAKYQRTFVSYEKEPTAMQLRLLSAFLQEEVSVVLVNGDPFCYQYANVVTEY